MPDTIQLLFFYDGSAQFDATKSSTHTQLWTDTAEVYEGDAEAEELDFAWTVVSGGRKTWGLGQPTARMIRCRAKGADQGALAHRARAAA